MRAVLGLNWAAIIPLCAWLLAIAPSHGRAADLAQILRDGHVPGLSYALIRDGKIVEAKAVGVRDISTGFPVDAETIFEAASLSKPVFAYAVLQLVDAGLLSLDDPLSKHVPDYVADDPRAASITVRNILSHTSGLPNWRSKNTPLKTYFQPGARFSYSGEGYLWLQRVVEKIAGQPLNDIMARLVFDPLEMRRSSFIWRADFETDYARPHDANGVPADKRKPLKPRAAATLHTTASDYARFLQAVLSGARLKPDTAKQWLEPQIRLLAHCFDCLAADRSNTDQHVAWGLGWGLEPDGGSFFHWGDNGGFKAFAIGSPSQRSGLVIFTNGRNGMEVMPAVVKPLMPGDHPAFTWLDHPQDMNGGTWLDRATRAVFGTPNK